jgi:16S rRNA (cytidine1402-2'-O)-methyltransferase
MQQGILYVVPTPIGNLEDITLRAIRVLKEVDLIIAEDTRQSLKLLNHFEIKKTIQSYHMHNEHKVLQRYVDEILGGKNIALVSDSFCFEGFLPEKKGRQTMLKKLCEEERTIILYESPHRLLKTLKQFIEYFGAERLISVSRELTKTFEETVNGTIQEVLTHFENNIVKGEFVIVIDGKK